MPNEKTVPRMVNTSELVNKARFALRRQTRSISPALCDELHVAFDRYLWNPQSVILIAEASTVFTADDAETAMAYLPKEGVTIAGKTLTPEAYRLFLEGLIGQDAIEPVDGNHRAATLMQRAALGLPSLKPEHRTKAGNDANDGFRANLAQAKFAPLKKGENLAAIVALRKAGDLKKEADLKAFYGRGLCQKLWAQSTLVMSGVELKDATKLDKETARTCSKVTTKAGRLEAVKSAIANGTTQTRAIPGPRLVEYAKGIDDTKGKGEELLSYADLADILRGIAAGDETTVETALGLMAETEG